MRNPVNLVFAAIAALTGLVTALSGLPLVRRRVPPNCWYGFRTPRTLRDERVWYEVNAYVGRLLVWYGLAILVTGGLMALAPPLPEDVLVAVFLAVVFAGLVALLVLSFRQLNRLWRRYHREEATGTADSDASEPP